MMIQELAAPHQEEQAPAFEPVIIRYEGNLAVDHKIELHQLGESLQGFAKTLAVAANFAHTGAAALHYDALDVKVIAEPTPEHRCFEVWATIQPIVTSKEFWAGAIGAGATVFAPVLTYILSRRTGEEMKFLNEALQKSMSGNQAVTEKLVSTIEKLADALNPSVRKALSPIDRSCRSIDIYSGTTKVQSMDSETKAAFAAGRTKIADHSKLFKGLITEFDMTSGACKVQLDGNEERIPAKVVDPVYSEPNNPYVSAMAAKSPLGFLAKFEENGEGRIVRMHIFDTDEL